MRKVFNGKDKNERIDGTGKADTIYGNGGSDKLSGHKGDDDLYGGKGNDRLHGGEDHDLLVGGLGRDTFIFRSFDSTDSDKVKDFKHGYDFLQLDVGVLTASSPAIFPRMNFMPAPRRKIAATVSSTIPTRASFSTTMMARAATSSISLPLF